MRQGVSPRMIQLALLLIGVPAAQRHWLTLAAIGGIWGACRGFRHPDRSAGRFENVTMQTLACPGLRRRRDAGARIAGACHGAIALGARAGVHRAGADDRGNALHPELYLATVLRRRAHTMTWTPGLVLDYARALQQVTEPERSSWIAALGHAVRAYRKARRRNNHPGRGNSSIASTRSG